MSERFAKPDGIPRILLIDDCEDDALLAIAALRRARISFEPRTVARFDEVMAALEEGGWSAVISDYNLGEVTGIDVLRAVRERLGDVPFLLVSAAVGDEVAADAIRRGANDYVSKDRLTRLPMALLRELSAAELRSASRELAASLEEIHDRYRSTFEHAPIGIAHGSAEGTFLSVNRRLAEILGYEPDELVGHPIAAFVHPDEMAEARAGIAALANGGDSVRFERRYIRKDGALIWTNVTLAPRRRPDGTLDYILGLVEDVSAQKASQEKLQLQAKLLECVQQAVIATDEAGKVTLWNRFAEAMYGWTSEEAIGRSILEVAAPARGSTAVGDIIQRVAAGESWSGEIVFERRDGSTFPALVVESPLVDERGAVKGSVGAAYDVSAHKIVADALREHQLQLAEAQEIARIGSWTYDFATGRRQWSDALCSLYGLPRNISGEVQPLVDLLHPDDRERMLELQRASHEKFEPFSTEYRIVRDGVVRTMLTRVRYVNDADGKPAKLIGVTQDVTEERQREEELRRRTVQQSAAANLGQLALSGASVEFLVEQAAISVKTVLDVDLASVLKKDDDEFLLVAGAGWSDGEIGVRRTPPNRRSHATLTVELGHPVVMTDVATETRFQLSEMLASKGVASGIYVPIHSSDGSAWGVLGAHATRPRSYAPHDVEFLRSIATVIGQAADRARADAELRTRARRQSAIAQIGQLVLDHMNNDVFERACELMIDGVAADYGYFTELQRNNRWRLRAGKISPTAGPTEGSVSQSTHGGYAILSGRPVVVDDLETVARPDKHTAAARDGIRSRVTVPVATAGMTFGVLAVESRKPRHFREEEIEFVQTVANMLAEAMDRELARHIIAESEHRYRRIFDGASEIIFTVDGSGRFVTLNPAFETITGWRREEWIGRAFAELLVPEDRERLLATFAGILRDRAAATAEMTILGKDRLVTLDVSSFPTVDETGEIGEIYGFARDITDARRAWAERERVTRNLELLLASTIEGIITLDAEGRGTMVNRAAAAMLQRAPEELIGQRVHDLVHSCVAVEDCAVFRVLRTGEPCTVASDTFERSDGTILPVAYSAAPIFDGGRIVGVVTSFTDLSERHRLEARLEQANRLSSLGRLAATVAHEFNNVLMGIAPFVEVIRRAPTPQKVAMSLDHIANSVKRGRRITQDILRFTQPAEPVRNVMDLGQWLNGVAVEVRSVIPPMYALSVVADRLSIEADANQLHQILMNLIFNARDAMPSGGRITLVAKRERRDARFSFGAIEDPSRYVHLLISDEGIGMSPDTLRHAFEPLFTTKRNGTGLGLAVTHQVVLRHGGEIFIESTPGEGTTFHIFLPLAEASVITAAPEEQAERTATHDARRLLLVEDDPTVAAGLLSILEFEGFNVQKAETGADALLLVRTHPFDAVLLDVGLPDIDGQAVYARIAELFPTLPVIFSTGHADRGQLEDLLTKPHVSFLLKPYDSDALLETLGRVMGNA